MYYLNFPTRSDFDQAIRSNLSLKDLAARDIMGDMADDAMQAEEDLAMIHPLLEQGTWRNKEGKLLQIKDMDTSYIENCIRFLIGKEGWIHKIQEFKMELANRKLAGERVIITKNSFEITEADIIELARSKGVKIPASGAGVYCTESDGAEWRINRVKVAVKFDTQKQLKKSTVKLISQRRVAGRKKYD